MLFIKLFFFFAIIVDPFFFFNKTFLIAKSGFKLPKRYAMIVEFDKQC